MAVSPAFGDLRAVEITADPAGEHTGKLFADLGVDVIKIEPPAGVPSRHIGPFTTDVAGDARRDDADASLAFWTYNTSKRSVVLADDADGRATRDRLIAGADILLTDAPPSRLATAGLDLDQLVRRQPRLIALSVTAFGLTGPWAEYRSGDLVALAAGGLLNSCGYDDHSIPPIRPGGNQGYMTAASFALCGALLALVERQGSGLGQLVDVSMHEAIAVSGELANPYWFYPKAIVKRQTARHAQPVPTQPAIFECVDGVYVYFALVLSDPKAWSATVAWMADLDLAIDLTEPAYSDYAYRQQQFAHVQDLLEVFFAVQDSLTVYHEGQRRGLPIAPVLAPEEVLTDEHLQARNFFVPLPLPSDETRTALFPGAPYQFSAFSATPSRPPRLGEHTREVLAELPGTDGVDHV